MGISEYIAMPVGHIISSEGNTARQLAMIESFSIGQHALNRCNAKPDDKPLVNSATPCRPDTPSTVQSKERYKDMQELVDVVSAYRLDRFLWTYCV